MVSFRHRQLFFVFLENGKFSKCADAMKTFDSHLQCNRDNSFFDQRYAQLPTVEPLSEDIERLARSELATLFYERVTYGVLNTLQFRHDWSFIAPCQIRLFDRVRVAPKTFLPPLRPIRNHLLEYADAHVCVYFAQFDKSFFDRHRRFSSQLLARYIWRKWFHLHGGRPPFLGYQKFVKGVGLKGSKARDIENIRDFHRSLCNAVSAGLDQQELPKPPRSNPRFRKRIKPENPEPPPPTNLKTYREKGREIAHLFRAIVMVVDDQVLEYEEPEISRPVFVPFETQGLGQLEQRRDWRTSQCSVLLLRTGDEAHLSSPISFQTLYDSGKALPVNRPDCEDEGMNVVRVKIDTALEFLFDLIRREREMIPSVGLVADMEDRQHSEVCEKWIDSVMERAGRVGLDTNGFTWVAIRRAKAALNGEAFDRDQTNPIWDHLGTTALPLGSFYAPDDPPSDMDVLS
ncbi:hypothetical protein F5Y04DRAFT_285120 [Hypomontagnella monticulosa]|nr:hypothetical protein F5Y04DRAFT_285120 [Hypomontagnella monticulosa]